MHAAIKAIEYYLPSNCLSTTILASECPSWNVEKIDATTGISCRHIAALDECASDLAVAAAKELFASGVCSPQEIDFILLCTQSPDYFLPTTACLLQNRLGIATNAGAFDFNLGSSGYVYGLGLCEGLVASGQATKILLLTADTYSKFLDPCDRSVRTIFGDGATATFVEAVNVAGPCLGPFVYGSDGSGGSNLIVRGGGLRGPDTGEYSEGVVRSRSRGKLFMNGPEIFNFTLSAVPESIDRLLVKADKLLADIDLFVFHQANRYMLDHLRKRMRIPPEKFCIYLKDSGNTVSSTIPIALKSALSEGRLPTGSLAMLVGFGVGYSWGATLLRII